MTNAVALFAATVLLGCGHQQQQYESAAVIVQRHYGHERFDGGSLRWSLLEVIGPKGPYILGRSLPMQSNPGQTVTFHISNRGTRVTKHYTPDTMEGFFLCVPVVNRDGLNAAIVLKTTSEQQPAVEGD